MANYTFKTQKVHEKFLCHCGKECKVVLVAKTAWTKKMKMPSGKFWICENGHQERKFVSREKY